MADDPKKNGFPGYCVERVDKIIQTNSTQAASGQATVDQITTQINDVQNQIDTVQHCINPKIAEALQTYLMETVYFSDVGEYEFGKGPLFNESANPAGNLKDWSVLIMSFNNNDPEYSSFERLSPSSFSVDGDETDTFGQILEHKAPDVAFSKYGDPDRNGIADNLESYVIDNLFASDDQVSDTPVEQTLKTYLVSPGFGGNGKYNSDVSYFAYLEKNYAIPGQAGSITDTWNILGLAYNNGSPSSLHFTRISSNKFSVQGTISFITGSPKAPNLAFSINDSAWSAPMHLDFIDKTELSTDSTGNVITIVTTKNGNLLPYCTRIYYVIAYYNNPPDPKIDEFIGEFDGTIEKNLHTYVFSSGDLYNSTEVDGNLTDWNVLSITLDNNDESLPSFTYVSPNMFTCIGDQTGLFDTNDIDAPDIAFVNSDDPETIIYTSIDGTPSYNSTTNKTTVILEDDALDETIDVCYTLESSYEELQDDPIVSDLVDQWNDSTAAADIIDLVFANIDTVDYDSTSDTTIVVLTSNYLNEGQTVCYTLHATYNDPTDTVVDGFVEDWNVGHDYITKTPDSTQTYGLAAKKSALQSAKEVVTNNTNKATQAVSKWSKYLTGGFPKIPPFGGIG